MDYQKVQNYFNEVVKRFPPFRDSELFRTLVDYLSNYYFKDFYDDIPSTLKTLYEDNQLTESVYDQLLVSMGVYRDVIDNLNINEKNIFLETLSDFFQYKSSVEFFQKVARNFPDNFNIHELFIDYDENEEKWVLRAFKIYSDPYSDEADIPLDYIQTYYSVPSLLISPEQLDYHYNNNNLVLPLKSNLILLAYTFITEVHTLTNLSISTFLKQYGNEYITLYFKDQSFTVTLRNAYRLWYYLVWTAYQDDENWKEYGFEKLLSFSDELNPYQLIDIEEISNEIESLNTTHEIQNYFSEKIENPFLAGENFSQYSLIDYRAFLSSSIGDVITYVEGRLQEFEGELYFQEINRMLNEMYNSFILYQFTSSMTQLEEKYFEIMINTLPQLFVNAGETSSYMILHNFKPYHVELITQSFSRVRCNNNLQKALPDDSTYEFLLQLISADYASDLTDLVNSVINVDSKFEITPVDGSYFNFQTLSKSYEDLKDEIVKRCIANYQNLYELSDDPYSRSLDHFFESILTTIDSYYIF